MSGGFGVATAAFALDLTRPLSTARGEIREREGWLVGVDLPDGARGVGEATPLPGWTESRADCEAALAAAADAADPATALAACAERDAPAARHGVALAVADARARAADESLAAWLANPAGDDADHAPPAATVPVNATVSDGSVAETVAAAEAAVEAGFDCLKLKAGARDLDADLDRVRAVRAAVGEGDGDEGDEGGGIGLRVDANGAWDRETAVRAVEALAEGGVAYVEQPLPADDLVGHAALRGRGVGIALDETLAETDPDAALAANAADALVVKPMAVGGPDRALAVARTARAAGAEAVVTTTVDAAVARAAAAHVAAAIPNVPACGLATGDLLASDLSDDPAPVRNGAVAVPAGPGVCGARFDAAVWGRGVDP